MLLNCQGLHDLLKVQLLVCRTVYLETLSFEEQIRVFASSQVVLMTHGAALTGTLFMAPVRCMLPWQAFNDLAQGCKRPFILLLQ